MKNQVDLIVAGSFVFVALVVSAIFFFTPREPVAPSAPIPVVTAPATIPSGSVAMTNALPGGDVNASGGRGGSGGRDDGRGQAGLQGAAAVGG